MCTEHRADQIDLLRGVHPANTGKPPMDCGQFLLLCIELGLNHLLEKSIIRHRESAYNVFRSMTNYSQVMVDSMKLSIAEAASEISVPKKYGSLS